MDSPKFSVQWLQFIVMVLSISVRSSSAARFNIPRLSPTGGAVLEQPDLPSSAAVSKDLQTFYYSQTLDHFNYKPESYATFQQRFVMNFKHWGGAAVSAPILAYLGAEAPLDGDLAVIGFLNDNAVCFSALLVYIEHRYYGQSIPFGSREEAFRNASTLGYFNSVQAIADYAEIIMHIKNKLHASYSPVIVIGGSYGGMLASWLRLKYPHVALGALASSAPVLYFDKITPSVLGYYSVVAKGFREASETCYQTIRKSWPVIDNIASQPSGLSILSTKFRTCNHLKSASELRNDLELMYFTAAQYNRPPAYPVTVLCGGIDGSEKDDILSKIFAGVAAYRGNRPCYINPPTVESETAAGWSWQTCSEMVIPIGIDKNTMFQPKPFNLSSFINQCMAVYGVPPRPHWVSSHYGGPDIKLILRRFGSNIIFSNGLRDPYSGGDVLKHISESILAVSTVNGSHCLDILSESDSDPDWLIRQRKIEVKIIKSWMAKYYADLIALMKIQ